jgi:hypothetical protein
MNWELFDGKDTHGPFTEAAVVEAIRKGMKPETLARFVGNENWNSLRTHAPFAFALEQIAKLSAPVPPPYSGSLPIYPTSAPGPGYHFQGSPQHYFPPHAYGDPPPRPNYAQSQHKQGMSAAGIILSILVSLVVFCGGTCVLCICVGATNPHQSARGQPMSGRGLAAPPDPAPGFSAAVPLSGVVDGDPTCPNGEIRIDGESGKSIRCTGAPTPVSRAGTGSNLQRVLRHYECVGGDDVVGVSGFNPCKEWYLTICKAPARDASAEQEILDAGCKRASSNASAIDYCCPTRP